VSAATGPHVQGVVALLDNRAEDGGTVLVPGFHSRFDAW
jgi:ectoine hydroxylase-related dioxygenase (phytanoyl-CoA dioxygenase family)